MRGAFGLQCRPDTCGENEVKRIGYKDSWTTAQLQESFSQSTLIGRQNPLSCQNGTALTSLLCSVFGGEQPRESMASVNTVRSLEGGSCKC